MSSGDPAVASDGVALARAGRRARETAGVSAEQMAAALGVPVGVLLRWEDGLLVPDGVESADWARFVHVLELHDGQDEVPMPGV